MTIHQVQRADLINSRLKVQGRLGVEVERFGSTGASFQEL